MRRIIFVGAALLCAAGVLAPAAGAAGPPAPVHRAGDPVPPAAARHARIRASVPLRQARAYHPLRWLGAGTAQLNGTVRHYDGSVMPDAFVSWCVNAGDYPGDYDFTDTNGQFTFADAEAAVANGSLYVEPDDTWNWMQRNRLTWADPGPTTSDFRPGRFQLDAQRGGPWGQYWSRVYVYSTTAAGQEVGWARTDFEDASGTAATLSTTPQAMPGSLVSGSVYFYSDEGAEFAASGSVAAGATTATSITVNEADAQRTWVESPFWGSGKPSTRVKLALDDFPAGWTLDLEGYADAPTLAYRDFGTLTTTGADEQYRTVTVPRTAKPGYNYRLSMWHSNGLQELVLETPFQVATLAATKGTISRGGSVRLSGVVPTEGHWGSTPGSSKRVTLYKRTRAAGQPKVSGGFTKWNGWTRVGSFRANGYGKFRTGLLRPSRSTWYVVWYPGDDWYHPAYTSVRKVTVK